MNWLQILLYAFSIFLVIYVFVFFYALESLITFRSRLKKRTLAISLLLSEKKDVLLSMLALMEKDIKDESTKEEATQVRWLKVNKLQAKEIENCLNLLSSLQKRLVLFANNNEHGKSEEFLEYFDILNDLDANYRKTAAIYNSDLLGYEYWRKTPLFRFWFFVFRFKEIKRLP